jgi:hypothetical protein
MFSITALNGLDDATLELGYKRIGRLITLSLDHQGLSNNRAVDLVNRLYRTGEGVGKVQPGQFGRFLRGEVRRPNYATLCDLAVLAYKPSHFLVTPRDPIGQPVIKAHRHERDDRLVYGTAIKAEELPNFESRCTGSDLIGIILEPPVVTDLRSGFLGNTLMLV